ncbi:PilW family protein [Actimicrobium antarcticum]
MAIRSSALPRPDSGQTGLSLIELLLALGLGVLVIAVAGTVFLASRRAYVLQENSVQLSETGRYGIDRIVRAVRQAGFVDPGLASVLDFGIDSDKAAISGLDARSLKSTTVGIDNAVTAAVNGSDVLAVRFAGTDDGSVVDCAGFAVGSASGSTSGSTASGNSANPGWSIFYVARGSSGEPELYCKYLGRQAWSSTAIARGVESFQVLYGIGPRDAARPVRYLTATQVNALDAQLTLRGVTLQQREQDKNRQTHWKNIREIKIALLLRSSDPVRADNTNLTHDLFGSAYSEPMAAIDPGVRINEAMLPLQDRKRLRKVFSTTIPVRNPAR